MPTYEYACNDCGKHQEVVQSFTDEPLTVCPACGGALRKVFGSIGIAFKGSGFYKNDSRSSKKSTTTAKADTSSGTSTEKTASDSTSSSSTAAAPDKPAPSESPKSDSSSSSSSSKAAAS